MKKFMRLIFSLFFISVFLLSCDKNDLLASSDNNDDDNYYVQYEAKCTYPQIMRSFSVRTDAGHTTTVDETTRSWTETYGPVSKGFSAYISATGAANAVTKIYISKNQESFSLKATGSSSASYTIDF